MAWGMPVADVERFTVQGNDTVASLRPNKALYLTPENVAKIRDYGHLYRVARVVQGCGAQVSFNVVWLTILVRPLLYNTLKEVR